MKCLKKYLYVLSVCACVPVLLADTLSSQYLNIRNKLTELKSQSELVTEQLTRVSENLRISQEEAKKWEETSTTLSESLTSITQQFNDCDEQLVIQQTKNRQLKKITISLISILAVLILTVAIVLYLELTKKTDFI